MHHHQQLGCSHGHEDRFAGGSRQGGFRGIRGLRWGIMGGRGGGFPFGRFVGDGELRLIVLSLIAENPRHGYDIIKALEERSQGFYSPSPGVIYPTLTYLEEAGHAVSSAKGNKKTYAITESGRGFLQENREADAILSRIEWIGARLAQARHFFERGEDSRDSDIPGVVPELNAARRAIKAALASKLGSSSEEQYRIAELLLKAAREIAGNRKPGPDDIDLG
jgi:DNA-binding PadR family transcriptional regulator